jgi:hypothetical protein
MTRTLTTAVLAAVLLTNNLMAQDVRPHSLEADPIASATERIMNRFFPAREQARTVDELQVEDESEPLPWWGVSTGPVGQLVEHRSLDVGHVTTATAKRERTGRFLFSRRKWKLRD